MVDKLVQQWSGRMVLETLFRHSKSEDIYPVLHATDGVTYRLHRAGDSGSSRNAFASFANSYITLSGQADNLRGHWRIVLSAADLEAIVACASNGAATLASDPTLDPAAESAPLDSACSEVAANSSAASPTPVSATAPTHPGEGI